MREVMINKILKNPVYPVNPVEKKIESGVSLIYKGGKLWKQFLKEEA